MVIKLLLFFAVAFVTSEIVNGLPKPAFSERELETKLAKFLAQDKEVQRALHDSNFGADEHLRIRRQSEVDGMDLDSQGDIPTEEEQGGFFDRAARFIVDLVQRFLKWINTDSN